MTSTVRHVTFDCRDAYQLATWWTQVVGGAVHEDDQPGDTEVLVVTEPVPLLFIQVPDEKVVKNRLHVDVQPADHSRDEEVQRLLGLGATLVDDRRTEDGSGWAVLADPEGNEFCVERSAAERTG